MALQWRLDPGRTLLGAIIITAVLYCRDLQYDFLLDDIPLILLNQTISSWRNWKAVLVNQIFPLDTGIPMAIHYRPVYVFWLMLNHQLFGGVLPWWHMTSLLLHLLAVFLVYRTGLLLFKRPWTATLGALLFALHPIHPESVTYVSASTDILVTVFFLGSFLTYYRFREEKISPVYWAASIVFGALAVFSKETGVMVPLALLAFELIGRTEDAGTIWKRALWTAPHFATVAAYLGIRTLLFGRNFGPGPAGGHFSEIAKIPLVLLAYLRTLVWPVHLSFYYPSEWVLYWTPFKAFALAVVAIGAATLWRLYRGDAGSRLQMLWVAVFCIPPLATVFAFPDADWVHDRHMYLVSVPFCLLLGCLLTDFRLSTAATRIASCCVTAIFVASTFVQVPRFSDEVTLYRESLQIAPRNEIARRFYPWALWNVGKREEGLQELKTNLELWPDSPVDHASYADALDQSGRRDEAASEYRKVIGLTHDRTRIRVLALYHLAIFDSENGKFAEAESYLREAIQIESHTLNYHGTLAVVLRQEGKSQEADEQLRAELNLKQQLLSKSKAVR